MRGLRNVLRSLRALPARAGKAAHDIRYPSRARKERRASEEITVSVVVPVKDAGTELADLIARMKAQEGFRRVELVIVDSGSTDGSAETAEALGATVVRITPTEFSHSHARNLGAERATGDYVLFTVQDALPSSERWLHDMYSGLQRHEAAAVSCGETPRADSDLFYRVISWNHHRFMTVDGGDQVMARPNDDDPVNRRRNAQISDTACLVARDLFLQYRHRGNYAEDLDLGLRLIDHGYRLAFLTAPRIVHSHHRPAWYHLKRSYVEHLSMFAMLPGYPTAPGDVATVAGEIAGSCAAIDRLVNAVLRDLPVPCPPAQVREAVTNGLRSAAGSSSTRADHLDERSRAFVKRLQDRLVAPGGAPAAGAMLDAVASVSGLICDYLDDAGQAVDVEGREEFAAALYKGWALHCGVRLASVYWRGPEDVREALRAEHADLTSGV